MTRISIVGGTGLIGSALVKQLDNGANRIHILTRGKDKTISDTISHHQFNFEKDEWPTNVLVESEVVINLAGRSIGEKRLVGAFKDDVYKSRVALTKSLVTILNNTSNKCNTLINGSAIGYYGYDRGEERLDEDADPGIGFMAKLCVDWEKEARNLDGDKRLIILRTGVVLDKEEGAFPKLKNPILLGLGSALASGRQYIPWIHINDMVSVINYCISNNKIKGIVNAVGPKPVRNRRLVGSISDSLNKAILLPKVPGFVLKLLLGEFANSIIGGLNVSPKKLMDHNFLFQYNDIDSAVKNLNWNK